MPVPGPPKEQFVAQLQGPCRPCISEDMEKSTGQEQWLTHVYNGSLSVSESVSEQENP